MGNLADLRLAHCAQWCKRAPELRLPQAEQKIRLILPQIDSLAKDRAITVMLDHGVMTGGDIIAA